MPELNSVLYYSLGIPYRKYGNKLASNYNSLTSLVDGNIDSNNDGEIDIRDKNGRVEPEELYQEVFNNREKYTGVIGKLQKAGLEDPFEIIPDVKQHVHNILNKYKPKTKIDKAIILARSIIPRGYSIRGQYGIPSEEGGLEVEYNKNMTSPIRRQFGSLLPKDILKNKGSRIGQCLEISFLLTVVLRAGGINAHVIQEEGYNHVYVYALFDNKYVKFSLGYLCLEVDIFTEVEELKNLIKKNSDRRGIAMHYIQNGVTMAKNGKMQYSQEIEYYDNAIKFDPHQSVAWLNWGIAELALGRYEGAKMFFKKSIELNPLLQKGWYGLGVAYDMEDKKNEAINSYKKAIELQSLFGDSVYLKALNKLGILYFKLNKLDMALKYFNKSIGYNRNNGYALYGIGMVYLQKGKVNKSIRFFNLSIQGHLPKYHAWIGKSMAMLKKGMTKEAKDYYLKGLAMYIDEENNNCFYKYRRGEVLSSLLCYYHLLHGSYYYLTDPSIN